MGIREHYHKVEREGNAEKLHMVIHGQVAGS